MTMKYKAERCGCRSPNCPDWHVSPVAVVQGVNFTERQARAVAAVLNALEEEEEEETIELLLAVLKSLTLDYALERADANEPKFTDLHPYQRAMNAIREVESRRKCPECDGQGGWTVGLDHGGPRRVQCQECDGTGRKT